MTFVHTPHTPATNLPCQSNCQHWPIRFCFDTSFCSRWHLIWSDRKQWARQWCGFSSLIGVQFLAPKIRIAFEVQTSFLLISWLTFASRLCFQYNFLSHVYSVFFYAHFDLILLNRLIDRSIFVIFDCVTGKLREFGAKRSLSLRVSGQLSVLMATVCLNLIAYHSGYRIPGQISLPSFPACDQINRKLDCIQWWWKSRQRKAR